MSHGNRGRGASSSLRLSQMSTEVLTDGQSSPHQLLQKGRHSRDQHGSLQVKNIQSMPKESVRRIFRSADWVREALAARLPVASTIRLGLRRMGCVGDIFFLYCSDKYTIWGSAFFQRCVHAIFMLQYWEIYEDFCVKGNCCSTFYIFLSWVCYDASIVVSSFVWIISLRSTKWRGFLLKSWAPSEVYHLPECHPSWNSGSHFSGCHFSKPQ